MAETMIERVARHLCERAGQDPDELAYPPLSHAVRAEPRTPADRRPLWWQYRGQAREIMALMREPTSIMTDAGFEAESTANPDKTRPHHVVPAVWSAMIDAALSE